MRVRMLIGPRTGQVVDIVYHAARGLLDSGFAERVVDGAEGAPTVEAPAPAAATPASTTSSKRQAARRGRARGA